MNNPQGVNDGSENVTVCSQEESGSDLQQISKSLEAKNIQLFSIHIQFMDLFFFLKAGMNIISACLLHIPLACAKAVKASIHY